VLKKAIIKIGDRNVKTNLGRIQLNNAMQKNTEEERGKSNYLLFPPPHFKK
jgi:hypothetical protein